MESARLNRAAVLGGTAAWAVALGLPADAAEPAGATVSAKAALERLEEGNERFVSGHLNNVSNLVERRTALAGGQSPYATILTCSDSRTPPELIFDANVGRYSSCASPQLMTHVAGTVEFALEAIASNLLLVGARKLRHGSRPRHIGRRVPRRRI